MFKWTWIKRLNGTLTSTVEWYPYLRPLKVTSSRRARSLLSSQSSMVATKATSSYLKIRSEPQKCAWRSSVSDHCSRHSLLFTCREARMPKRIRPWSRLFKLGTHSLRMEPIFSALRTLRYLMSTLCLSSSLSLTLKHQSWRVSLMTWTLTRTAHTLKPMWRCSELCLRCNLGIWTLTLAKSIGSELEAGRKVSNANSLLTTLKRLLLLPMVNDHSIV